MPSTQRSLTLTLSAWRHLDNLAARLGLSIDETLERLAANSDPSGLSPQGRSLLDTIATALTRPVTPDFSPYRLAPTHPVSVQIAHITVAGGSICVQSDWNPVMIETVKALGYRWDDIHFAWHRQITKLSAPLTDRLVELGVHLLAAGIIIEVPSQELANRISAADYRPERKRWVAVSKLDRYAGWFYIFWPYGELYRNAVQHLTGARLFRSSAVVPATSFDEVLDFADRHDFAISDKALTLAAQADRDRAAMFIANPTPVRPATLHPLPVTYSSSDDIGIDPTLADVD